jgi:hypothetical protein
MSRVTDADVGSPAGHEQAMLTAVHGHDGPTRVVWEHEEAA